MKEDPRYDPKETVKFKIVGEDAELKKLFGIAEDLIGPHSEHEY